MWQKVLRLIVAGVLSSALAAGWIVTPVGGNLPVPGTYGGDPGSGSGGG